MVKPRHYRCRSCHSFYSATRCVSICSFLKAGWKSLGVFTSLDETYMMSFEDWQYVFVNGMALEDQQKSYETYKIPESKTVARGALTDAAKVDFNKDPGAVIIVNCYGRQ